MVVKNDRLRYIFVDFLGKIPPVGKFITYLRGNVKKLRGEIFLAQSALSVVEYGIDHAIVKCSHLARDTVEAGLQLINLPDFTLVVRYVSGTIKSLDKSINGLIDD